MNDGRFLLVRTSSLGDVVLATAVLDALSHARPDASIEWLTRRAFVPLFEPDARVRRVWTLEEHARGGSMRGLAGLAQGLRRGGAPVVVDLQGGVRGRWLALACRTRRIGAGEDGARRRAIVRRGRLGFPGRVLRTRPAENAATRMLRAVDEMVPRDILRAARPRLAVREGDAARVDACLPRDAGALVVACTAARGEKRWERESFDRLARTLVAAREDLTVVLVHDDGPEPESLRTTGAPADRVRQVRAPLRDVVALLSLAHAVVAGDTGLAHVASAVGAPVVRLFGPTTPSLGFAPLDARDVVIEEPLSCRPCSVHGTRPCWRRDRACMTGIAPDRVARTVLAVLEATGRA